MRIHIYGILIIALLVLALAAASCGQAAATSSTSPPTPSAAQPSPPVAVTLYGPVPPFNPGGPQVEIIIKNVSNKAISSLTANLVLNKTYVFNFTIPASQPLPPNSSITAKQTLIGASISDSTPYSLQISGAFQDGAALSYSQSVTIGTLPPGTTPATFDQKSSTLTAANGLSLVLSIDS